MPNQSPNLLSQNPSQSRINPIVEKHHLTFAAAAKLTIILVQAIFVVLLGFNATTISEVAKLETEVKALELQLNSKQASIELIENVIEKTEMLKVLKSERPALAARVGKALELVPPQVTVIQATIRPASMEIVVETASPVDAALVLNAYFTQGLANQITLNSANLSTTTGKFLTNMEVEFK